jgi:hypothetical protein
MDQSQPTRAALYVDFDNVFLALARWDERAAYAFGERPDAWLAWLEGRSEGGPARRRRTLVRRCYLNPAGSWDFPPLRAVARYRAQRGLRNRVYFGDFRAAFVQAGFDVVDCPPVSALKNSADMKMALDVREALDHATRFEEFVLLSGDSDFLPALARLRAHDRRITVLAQGTAKPAYLAAADLVVGLEDFAAEGMGDLPIAQMEAIAPTRVEQITPTRVEPVPPRPEPIARTETNPPPRGEPIPPQRPDLVPPARIDPVQARGEAPAPPPRAEAPPPEATPAEPDPRAANPRSTADPDEAAAAVRDLLWGARDRLGLPQDLPAFTTAELAALLTAIAAQQPIPAPSQPDTARAIAQAVAADGHFVSAREASALLRWLIRGFAKLAEPAEADGALRLARILYVTLVNALMAEGVKLTDAEKETLRDWTQAGLNGGAHNGGAAH